MDIMKILILILCLCVSAAEGGCQTGWNSLCFQKAPAGQPVDKIAHCTGLSSDYVAETDNCEIVSASCSSGWTATCFQEIPEGTEDPAQFCETAIYISSLDQCRMVVLVQSEDGGGVDTEGWGGGSIP